jgi:Cdc6-like AAA superfamily ATPase
MTDEEELIAAMQMEVTELRKAIGYLETMIRYAQGNQAPKVKLTLIQGGKRK